MIQQVIILLVGFIFLVKGADWFVEGAASIARKLGIPQLIIGLTIVAMGTSIYYFRNYSLDHQCKNTKINHSL